MPKSGEKLKLLLSDTWWWVVWEQRPNWGKKLICSQTPEIEIEAVPGFNASHAGNPDTYHHHMNTYLLHSKTVPLFWGYLQATRKKQVVPAHEHQHKKNCTKNTGILALSLISVPFLLISQEHMVLITHYFLKILPTLSKKSNACLQHCFL